MKNKYLKRLLGIALSISMFASVAGCAKTEEAVVIEPMEAEESHAISFDIIGGKDVMPIGGYYGPWNMPFSYNGQNSPEFQTEETVKLIADAGVNLVISFTVNYDATPRDVKNLLDWGEKHGVGMLVKDAYLNNHQDSVELLNERLGEYRNHPAYCGIYLVDEPGGKTYYTQGANGGLIQNWKTLSQKLRKDCDVFCYDNLIKIVSLSQKEGYEQYIQEFIDTMQPEHLSYDYYPFDTDTLGDNDRYFWNLAIIREYAQKYEIPFWTFIQAGSQWDRTGQSSTEYVPTEGQMDWSVHCALAFGAQGVQYFPLIQPWNFGRAVADSDRPWDFERNGLIGTMGNLNRWYFYAQDVNKQIAEVDDVLMNSVSKGVIASGKQAIQDTSDARDAMMKGTSWRELAGVQGDALVGCFNYQGKTALYVVNYDTEYAQDVTLDFHDTYKIRVSQLGETEYYKTNQLTLKMEAGDGALIVFE